MKRIVVADSGPLIVFARSGLLGVLRKVAGKIVLPQTVFDECVVEGHRPGAQIILSANDSGLIEVMPDAKSVEPFLVALGPGERAALGLAMSLSCPILIDDQRGRLAAQSLGLHFFGGLAVLLSAKRKGKIKKIEPILEEWEQFGYFMSKALKTEVLERAGEKKKKVKK